MLLMKLMPRGSRLCIDPSGVHQMINRINNPNGEPQRNKSVRKNAYVKEFGKEESRANSTQSNVYAEHIDNAIRGD